MRKTMTRWCVAAALSALAGCGAIEAPGAPSSGGTLDQAELARLPACDGAQRPAAAKLAVEERGEQLVVWAVAPAATVALCAGSPDAVLGSGVLDGSPHLVAPRGADPAASDPMPADGRDEASSDPMPADGRHLLDSDPMPADGRHPAESLAHNAALTF
jgi:hypothetical protein